jgi:hypothetical protein
LTPIWTAGRFVEEKPRDERGFVFNGVFGFLETTFFALEVATAVANLLDFEGDGCEAALFRLLGGAIAKTRPKHRLDGSRVQRLVRGCEHARVVRGYEDEARDNAEDETKMAARTKVIFCERKNTAFRRYGTDINGKVHKKQKAR